MKLKTVKDWASVSQSVLTGLAIILAAIWFFEQREPWPKANITHEVTHLKLNDKLTLIHVSVTISNIGKRLLVLNSGTTWVQQIRPLDSILEQQINQGEHLIPKDGTVVPWPKIGEPIKKSFLLRMEPGESDTLDYEFIIPNNVRTIRIYSYIEGQKTSTVGWSKTTTPSFGWHKGTIYEVTKDGGSSND